MQSIKSFKTKPSSQNTAKRCIKFNEARALGGRPQCLRAAAPAAAGGRGDQHVRVPTQHCAQGVAVSSFQRKGELGEQDSYLPNGFECSKTSEKGCEIFPKAFVGSIFSPQCLGLTGVLIWCFKTVPLQCYPKAGGKKSLEFTNHLEIKYARTISFLVIFVLQGNTFITPIESIFKVIIFFGTDPDPNRRTALFGGA